MLVAAAALACGCGALSKREAAKPAALYLAAMYDIEHAGERIAVVQLWTEGVYRGDVDGKAALVVHVVARVSNQDRVPLTLGELGLEARTHKGALLARVAPAEIDGDVLVRGWLTEDVNLYFALPMDVTVDAFRLTWGVERKRVAVFSEATAFRRAKDTWDDGAEERFYYSPIHDPMTGEARAGGDPQVHDFAYYVAGN